MSIVSTEASPFVKLRSAALNACKWTGGFWGDRFQLCRDVIVPTMCKHMAETERVKFVGNFEVAAGLVEGRHRGPRWNDGDFCKWFEGAAAIAGATNSPELIKLLDGFVDIISKAQDPDGYIHTDIQIQQKAQANQTASPNPVAANDANVQGNISSAAPGTKAIKRFGNPMDFEMYNMGHLISAAIVYYRATGRTNLLTVAEKAAAFLEKEFANPVPAQARHGICPAHLMALVELYRLKKDKRWLNLAIKLLKMRDLVEKGDDDNQDRIPFRQQTTAHGHGVRSTYLYCGAADIYTETGDQTLLKPLELIWDDLVTKKLYITAGVGALFDGASPDGVEEQLTITRVHQSFGRNYQLPQTTAHNETCAAIGNMMWNWRMLQITGESKFGDIIESTLFNSVLAGISLDGTAYFYTNTLRQLYPMPTPLRWNRTRQKSMGCWCCPPNVVRTLAETQEYAYLLSDTGVSVILYGHNQFSATLPNGQQIKLKQESNYPWDEKIIFTIESAGEFEVSLRIPGWTHDATVRVVAATPASGRGGDAGVAATKGKFCTIKRKWSIGEKIELNLPMPVRLVEANPYIEEARNQIAVMRGPIVYCLESPDIPAGVKMMDVLIPSNIQLHQTKMDSLMPGLIALEGIGRAAHEVSWVGSLYRDLSKESLFDVKLKLIPYFAWDNRGQSEMSVWLPVMR